MRLYFDVSEYHDRLHQFLFDETYEVMAAVPELPDPPDRTSEMLAQVRKDVAKRDAADWLAVEQAKLPPLKYAMLISSLSSVMWSR